MLFKNSSFPDHLDYPAGSGNIYKFRNIEGSISREVVDAFIPGGN